MALMFWASTFTAERFETMKTAQRIRRPRTASRQRPRLLARMQWSVHLIEQYEGLGAALAAIGSTPITPSSSSKQGSPQPQSRKAYLLNQASTVYTALWHFWSMSTWQVAVHMARQVGGVLLEIHDSETTFCRMRDGAFADMKRRLGKELRSCRAFSLCMDEKDIFLVVAVKIITEEWDVITRLLSYRELSGFTAPKIFGCLQQMLTELDIEDPCDATLGDRTPTDLLHKCLGFTSDGASVMGSRRAFGLPGSNVAKLLQEACASRLLTTHCCAHRFLPCFAGKDLPQALQILAKPPSQPRGLGVLGVTGGRRGLSQPLGHSESSLVIVASTLT